MKQASYPFGIELTVGLMLRGAGAVSSFVLTLLLARQFGAYVVGLYQIGLTTATLASLVASLGLPIVLVREAALLLREQSFGDLAACYKRCRADILIAGLIAMVCILICAWPLGLVVFQRPDTIPFMIALAPLAVLLPVLRLNNELLRSLGDVWISQSLEGVFYTTMTAFLFLVLLMSDVQIAAVAIAVLYVVCVLTAFTISQIIISRKISAWGSGVSHLSRFSGLPALAPSLVMTATEWGILLLVGATLSLADAGIYRVIVLICSLILLVTASFATISGPHLARARAAGERRRFFSIVRHSGAIGLIISAPLAIAIFVAPDWVLGLFGEEFRDGADALVVLAIAQLIAVGNGPVASALLMLGKEKSVYRIEILCGLISIVGAVVLIDQFGLLGASAALLFASTIRCISTRSLLWFAWRPASRISEP